MEQTQATVINEGRASASASASRSDVPNSAASPSWVILGTVPRVASDLSPQVDLALALKAPPQVTLLSIPTAMFLSPMAFQNYPSVLAADPSGLLLLDANQGNLPSHALVDVSSNPIVPGFFVLDSLKVVHLPPSKQLLESRQEWIYLEKRRWVGVSAGTLRFVEMSGFPNRYDRDYDSDDAVDVSEIQINVWTLEDPDTSSWKLLYKMPVKKILGDDMYKAYELPSEVPELALMDPMDPRLLYFIVSNRIFSVNMVTKRVVTCERMDLAMQIPSRSVRPWLLPSILSADSDDVTGGLVELLAPQRFKRKHLHHRQLTSSANALNKNESQVNPEGVQPLF
ncbi:hypothetical protein CFC21_029186 [Triticum aestivum]|uniref:DUF1618 domain-containing protein n=2 Tax=Triticum aestivum TaxID=4565 RepID=A0A3B6DAT4_WHEAT|nr:hypothetical protein CFC21_029186 [Triticum aestivum]